MGMVNRCFAPLGSATVPAPAPATPSTEPAPTTAPTKAAVPRRTTASTEAAPTTAPTTAAVAPPTAQVCPDFECKAGYKVPALRDLLGDAIEPLLNPNFGGSCNEGGKTVSCYDRAVVDEMNQLCKDAKDMMDGMTQTSQEL